MQRMALKKEDNVEILAMESSVTLSAGTDEHCNNRQIRQLQQSDARYLHDLIVRCPPLDVNSLYAYALLSLHHSSTCFVAVIDEQICGAVTGYIPPNQPDTYFLWQVAVAPEQQGTGLGSQLLDHVFQHCLVPHQLTQLETTISPSNTASQQLFKRFAQRQQVDICHFPLFSSTALTPLSHADHALNASDITHEAEELYRLGTWKACTT